MTRTTGRTCLSRQEAQAQTRERLIEAARRLFVEDGFAGTSLRSIAEEAGHTQGAFYSNFASKEAVLLEHLKEIVDSEDQQLEAILANQAIDRIPDELEAWLTGFTKDRDWSVLAIEIQMHALRSPSFAESYADVRRAHERRIAVLIERTFERLGKNPPAEAEHLAAGLLALRNGLTVQESITRPARIAATLTVFLRAILAAGSSRENESVS